MIVGANSAASIALLSVMALLGLPSSGTCQSVTLLAGGDIEWAHRLNAPTIYQHPVQGWRAVPYFMTDQKHAEMEREQPEALRAVFDHYDSAIQYGLHFESDTAEARHPFRHIRTLVESADISFANLETALSATGRRAYDAALVTPPQFSQGIQWAGFDVVSIANNHAMDAEGEGLLDTMSHLRRAGIAFVGGGRDLSEARSPRIFEKEGIRIAFLAYAQFVNPSERLNGFAARDNSGVAPMDPFLIKEDVERIREDVDYVVVSLHWGDGGSSNSSTIREPHPGERTMAHEFIEAGADVILGHHPPLSRGIELYDGKPIFYSLGKLIFGHNHAQWTDNILVRITFGERRIEEIVIIPVAGKGMDMAQPFPLEGERASAVLESVRRRSEAFGTVVQLDGSRGVIRP